MICIWVWFHVGVMFFSGMLIDTVEVLGTHSIQTGELKQLIGSLRPLEEGKLVYTLGEGSLKGIR